MSTEGSVLLQELSARFCSFHSDLDLHLPNSPALIPLNILFVLGRSKDLLFFYFFFFTFVNSNSWGPSLEHTHLPICQFLLRSNVDSYWAAYELCYDYISSINEQKLQVQCYPVTLWRLKRLISRPLPGLIKAWRHFYVTMNTSIGLDNNTCTPSLLPWLDFTLVPSWRWRDWSRLEISQQDRWARKVIKLIGE